MNKESKSYFRTSRPYLSAIVGGIIGALLASVTNNWLAMLFGMFLGAIVTVLIAKPEGYVRSGCLGSLSALLAVLFVLFVFGGPSGTPAVIAMIVGVVVIAFLGGVIANYCRTSHTIRNVFHSPRFLVGFTIISIIVLTAVFYPMIDTRNPMYSYGDMFLRPGTYFSVYDANIAAYNTTTVHRVLNLDATEQRHENFLPESQLQVIGQYLARKWAWEQGYTVRSDYYIKADGTRGDARNLEQDVTDRVAAYEAQIEEKQADIDNKKAELESDPDMPEAKKTRYEGLITTREGEIETIQGSIDSLKARYESGKIVVDSDAMRLWSEETGLEANSAHRAELLALWAENYDKIVAANSGADLAALVPGAAAPAEETAEAPAEEAATDTTVAAAETDGGDGAEPTEPEAEPTLAERYAAFNNGTDFITNENGLGFPQADARSFVRIGRAMTIDPNGTMSYTQKNSTGSAEPIEQEIKLTDYTSVSEVANTVNFPLGTDNNGRDMLLLLISAAGKSLLVGLLAGSIATLLGLLVGLLAGYVGGIVDDILSFIMNIFTVIPGFVLMIIIYNTVDKSQRGIVMCGMIIGLTSWVWTARSVRSQVISLRNRDHVNLSKLSGHSLFRIILTDILPYIASYVVMAFILQVSSGILAEAQLSLLGLGPKTTEVPTLGLMMNWAMLYSAHLNGSWWAYFPVVLIIALISFSLNLMNTGLDQVFNPTLRD